MTGSYRVFTYGGTFQGDWGDAPGAIAITAIEDNTLVKIALSAAITGGNGINAASAGKTVEYTMNSGDVLQLLGKPSTLWDGKHADLTGSVIMAVDADNPGTTSEPRFKPVQVIGLSPIADLTPATELSYADHMEEIVLPAEIFGHRYVITPPTGPEGTPVKHKVRFVGSVDNTKLTYETAPPSGAPASLNAGQIVDISTTDNIVVSSQNSSHPFIAVSFIENAEPSVSMVVAIDQFRLEYSFLAPTSYKENFADIIIEKDATVMLDGSKAKGDKSDISGTNWSIMRVKLSNDHNGTHTLTSDKPAGLQVMGYGHATSYFYPGGLNLNHISDEIIIK
jgi:hypothetical protein